MTLLRREYAEEIFDALAKTGVRFLGGDRAALHWGSRRRHPHQP
ncbi:hypothetical protein [Streptomyces longwoodensis]